jgi:uncharacterized protein involved in outer membrane biogenesis
MARMRIVKWTAIGLAALLLVLGGAVLALNQWLGSADFRTRMERQASAALGVPLQLGALSVDLWPAPGLAADQVRLQMQPAISFQRVEVRPTWGALLTGRLEPGTLVVRGAVLPQAAIAALAATLRQRDGGGVKSSQKATGAAVPWPQRAVLDDITWIDAQGQRITIDARAQLGGDGLLDAATFKIVQGRLAGATGELQRAPDHWPVRVSIGGGRITGRVQVGPGKGGLQVLQGQLQTEGVEVSALTAPSKPLTGKLQATTTLRAEYRELGALADALQTQTRFTVRDALLQGLDLARAVNAVGVNRGGSTRLDTLSGQLHTQGRAVQLNNLAATSGPLAARGDVAMTPNRSLSGRITVDVPSPRGTVSVPLQVGGTADSPSVTLTREAWLALASGTSAGAKLSDQMGQTMRRLFGK